MGTHPTNKFLRRKAKPDIQRDEKTIKPRINNKIKYPKQVIQKGIEKFYSPELIEDDFDELNLQY